MVKTTLLILGVFLTVHGGAMTTGQFIRLSVEGKAKWFAGTLMLSTGIVLLALSG